MTQETMDQEKLEAIKTSSLKMKDEGAEEILLDSIAENQEALQETIYLLGSEPWRFE